MANRQIILVTGATGLVGKAIISVLSQANRFKIISVGGKNSQVEGKEQSESFYQFYQADISDYKTFAEIEKQKKVDILIHAAGLAHQFGKTEREDFWRVNVLGTANVWRLAEKLGVEYFILISSVSVYGNYGNIEVDESFKCNPEGFYAESKLESEKVSIEAAEKNNLSLTILRLGTVIGEGDRGNVSRLIETMDRGRFFWIGKGNNKKSLIYKNDVAEAVLKVLEKKASGREIYNLTAEPVKMKNIVSVIAQNLNKKIPRWAIPSDALRKIFKLNNKTFSIKKLERQSNTLEKWLSDDIYSNKKFCEKYNFKFRTTVAEAIERQVNYYLAKKPKKIKR